MKFDSTQKLYDMLIELMARDEKTITLDVQNLFDLLDKRFDEGFEQGSDSMYEHINW